MFYYILRIKRQHPLIKHQWSLLDHNYKLIPDSYLSPEYSIKFLLHNTDPIPDLMKRLEIHTFPWETDSYQDLILALETFKLSDIDLYELVLRHGEMTSTNKFFSIYYSKFKLRWQHGSGINV